MSAKPFRFSSFGGYRRFCWPWWKDLWRTITVGWVYDIRTYWHRARYGWAPRDTWGLDAYLATVMAGSIRHLAETCAGSPGCFPYDTAYVVDATTGEPRPFQAGDDANAVICDHNAWREALHRWAYAFERFTADDYYEKHGSDYRAWNADEKARNEKLHETLREMEPWFDALWN